MKKLVGSVREKSTLSNNVRGKFVMRAQGKPAAYDCQDNFSTLSIAQEKPGTYHNGRHPNTRLSSKASRSLSRPSPRTLTLHTHTPHWPTRITSSAPTGG